ncbi:MAG: SDR family oxidoreductase [Bacteroidota bacterium]
MKDFSNKVAVITGAGSGIGRALAVLMAQSGAKLALNDYQEQGLQGTLKLIEPYATEAMTKVFDVSKKEAMHSFADDVIAHYGKADLMFNNAGVALGRVATWDLEYDDFEWVMGINFWGMVYGSKAFLPHLIKQKESALINISSLFGLMGVPFQTAYCSSKFAIRGYNESLRAELKLFHPHVTVTSVHPGGIKTNIARDSKDPVNIGPDPNKDQQMAKFEAMFRTTPEDAAKTIINGVKKKRGRVLIGRDAKFPDKIIRLLPERYTGFVVRSLRKSLGDESFIIPS